MERSGQMRDIWVLELTWLPNRLDVGSEGIEVQGLHLRPGDSRDRQDGNQVGWEVRMCLPEQSFRRQLDTRVWDSGEMPV